MLIFVDAAGEACQYYLMMTGTNNNDTGHTMTKTQRNSLASLRAVGSADIVGQGGIYVYDPDPRGDGPCTPAATIGHNVARALVDAGVAHVEKNGRTIELWKVCGGGAKLVPNN